MIALFFHLIHWVFLIFMLVGSFLPWTNLLWVHFFAVPFLILHWHTNENRCILTELEEKAKARAMPMAIGSHSGPARTAEVEEGAFIRGILTVILGRTPSDRVMVFLIYGIMALLWIITTGRLAAKFLNELRIF